MHKYIKNNKSARFELGYYLSGIIIKVPSVLYNAVITAFLIESGFSMTQIGIVWSITLFSNTILDFPTGGFADKFGRLNVTDTLNCPEIANLICHDPANVRDIKCISYTQITASPVNRDSRQLLFCIFQ